jgi:hypothetical protein
MDLNITIRTSTGEEPQNNTLTPCRVRLTRDMLKSKSSNMETMAPKYALREIKIIMTQDRIKPIEK